MSQVIPLLKSILSQQAEQNTLLKAVVERQNSPVRQNAEWKNQNPILSGRCQAAAQRASVLLTDMIEHLVGDLEDLDADAGWGEDYAVGELIDKYGHRIQHLNAMLTALTQLGTS